MSQIATWDKLPPAIRRHLIDRMRDRSISIPDLDQLRRWIESRPVVPEGEWYKDFGSFKICGQGPFPKSSARAGGERTGPVVGTVVPGPGLHWTLHGFIYDHIWGGTSQSLTRLAPCPVLVVK